MNYSKATPITVLFICLTAILLPCHLARAQEAMENGVPLRTSLPPYSYGIYSIDVPQGSARLSVSITEGAGELDLFVRYGTSFFRDYDTFGGLYDDADLFSDYLEADEQIAISSDTSPPLQEGRWFIAAANLNGVETAFTLTAWYEESRGEPSEVEMPLPNEQHVFPLYDPLPTPVLKEDPISARPVAVGQAATDGNLDLEVALPPLSGPADIYLALYAPHLAQAEIFFFSEMGDLKAFSQVGLVPWRSHFTSNLRQQLLQGLPAAALPPGTYYIYLLVTPANNPASFYLWSTYFAVEPGPQNVPDGNAAFFGGSLFAPDATILYQGQAYQERATPAAEDIVAIFKDGETYLYHPALGNAQLSTETSRRAVGCFIFGASPPDRPSSLASTTVSQRMLVTTAATASPNQGKTLAPNKSVELATGINLERTGRVQAKASNKAYGWAAVKTSTGDGPYYVSPAGRIIDNNVLRLANDKLGINWGVLSNSSDAEFSLERGTVETYRSIWRLMAFILAKGQSPGPSSIPGYELRIQKDAVLAEKLDTLDVGLQILELLKCFISAADFSELGDLIANAAFNLAGVLYSDWTTGKYFLDPNNPALRNYLKTFLQDLANDVPTVLITVKTVGGAIPIFTAFDILGTLSFIYENAQDADRWAYDEINFIVPEMTYAKFLEALHAADSFSVSVAGQHKYINKADGSPAQYPSHYLSYGSPFIFKFSKTDIKWETETKFKAEISRPEPYYSLKLKGTVHLLSTGPVLDVEIKERFERFDQKKLIETGRQNLNISKLPFDKGRVATIIDYPGIDPPPWSEIRMFVPGSELDRKRHITLMEYESSLDVMSDGLTFNDYNHSYQKTEWIPKEEHGLYVKFNKN